MRSVWNPQREISMDSSGWLSSSVVVVVVATVSFVACSDAVESEGNEGLNVGEGTDVDVEFVLENESGGPVYIQRATFPSPGWLSVLRDDEPLYINEDRCVLPRHCDEEYGIDCDMSPPFVEQLESGDDLRVGWSGTEYVTIEEDDDRCYEATDVEPHENLDAEFCYGFETTDEPIEDRLEEPICESIEFQPATADELVVTVEEDNDSEYADCQTNDDCEQEDYYCDHDCEGTGSCVPTPDDVACDAAETPYCDCDGEMQVSPNSCIWAPHQDREECEEG